MFPYAVPALGERWAHLITEPERGCLLVARAEHLGMFTHSVILVLEHGEPGRGRRREGWRKGERRGRDTRALAACLTLSGG